MSYTNYYVISARLCDGTGRPRLPVSFVIDGITEVRTEPRSADAPSPPEGVNPAGEHAPSSAQTWPFHSDANASTHRMDADIISISSASSDGDLHCSNADDAISISSGSSGAPCDDAVEDPPEINAIFRAGNVLAPDTRCPITSSDTLDDAGSAPRKRARKSIYDHCRAETANTLNDAGSVARKRARKSIYDPCRAETVPFPPSVPHAPGTVCGAPAAQSATWNYAYRATSQPSCSGINSGIPRRRKTARKSTSGFSLGNSVRPRGMDSP